MRDTVEITFKFTPLQSGYLLEYEGQKIACSNMDNVASHIKNFIYTSYEPASEGDWVAKQK